MGNLGYGAFATHPGEVLKGIRKIATCTVEKTFCPFIWTESFLLIKDQVPIPLNLRVFFLTFLSKCPLAII